MKYLQTFLDKSLELDRSSSRTIQKVIYEEGTDAFSRPQIYSDIIEATPHMNYDIQIEVLLNDLGEVDEKISDISVNGISIGECNPNCGDMTARECDYACTFYDCTPHLTHTIVSSGSGTFNVKLQYEEHSRDCDCDKSTWQCQKENTGTGLSPMVAVARITLTPADEG